MTANTKKNVASVSLNTAFVDGIGVSVSNSGLAVLRFPRYMVFPRFF
jgi:hypothetical protein